MSQQQTVLRVQTNKPGQISGSTTYEFLDLYSSIPILINKSFAELGDIGKRNSDYSVGTLLPGSKKNNAFFENFFNVDAVSLYFNPNYRVPCNVLINDEPYFTGYMRLNKVSVLDSKIEYDVTLYSTPAELYGSIGNNLLRDLNFSDDDYRFNHTFNLENVTEGFTYPNFAIDGENPAPYFYPVVHNGYLYTGSTVNFTGGTILSRTRLYTSTANSAGQLDSYASQAAAWADGVQQYRINSPGQGLYNNQLKPALNIWSLLQLMFKTYGYQIESDFFNTPWMKNLYMYGYFSSDQTKFSFQVYDIQTLPLEGVEVFFVQISGDVYVVVSKLNTGIPCYCDNDINVTLNYTSTSFDLTIPYGTSGLTVSDIGQTFVSGSSPQVPNGVTLKYLPVAVGTSVNYVDGDFVDFNLVIDQNIKQIDILSSIAKKFNLVLIPDPNNGNIIRIEPYDFFIGTGEVHNWSDKISYDKGFTVEPALNFIESELQITDQEDSDDGNKLFKESNNRIYGQNYVYNPTDFKSQTKKIDTIFSPELIRKWDADETSNIGLPLGINYVSSNNQVGSGSTVNVNWVYKGVKTKPKLFWWLGSFNPFLDLAGENYDATNFYTTYSAYISDTSGSTFNKFDRIPVISHTMPMGNPDNNKINNDSQCILFNSEFPADTDISVQTFNTYTENDAYSTFYDGRVSNLYNPNTRVLTGFFNLNYADLKNLLPQDLIKINEQYFIVSKIEGFNLTNRELTKVELVQFNNRPKTYIDRYFKYFYCDNPSQIYKFKTDFTNPNLLDSNFGWSIYYDHQIGSFSGDTSNVPSGFTSTFKDDGNLYVPYYIYEVSESNYEASGIPWEYDSLHNYIYSFEYGPFQLFMPTFWLNSGSTITGINLFDDCATFETARTTYGILTGSSTNHGIAVSQTPTPTPTPTPSPQVNQAIRGSLLITLSQTPIANESSDISVIVNGENRNIVYQEPENLYSTYLYNGDIVTINLIGDSLVLNKIIEVTRRDYTTDDQGGDNGIRDTFITGYTGTSVSAVTVTFTASTISEDYNFEYLIDALTIPTPPPTPVPNPASYFISTAGITGTTEQNAITNLYNNLVSAGLWDKMYVIYPFVGGTSSTCSYNLVNPDYYQIDWYGTGLTFNSDGVTGLVNPVENADGYGDTNFNPKAFNYYTPITSDISFSVNTRNDTTIGYQQAEFGVLGDTPSSMVIDIPVGGNLWGNALSITPGAPIYGLYLVSSTSPTSNKFYKNAVLEGTNTNVAPGSPDDINYNIYLMALNVRGTAEYFAVKNMDWSHIGKGLTDADVTNLYNIVQIFQYQLGRGDGPMPTPTPTPTLTPGLTNTPTPSFTPTSTVTPTLTLTSTITPSITPTNTVTPTVTQTPTPSPSPVTLTVQYNYTFKTVSTSFEIYYKGVGTDILLGGATRPAGTGVNKTGTITLSNVTLPIEENGTHGVQLYIVECKNSGSITLDYSTAGWTYFNTGNYFAGPVTNTTNLTLNSCPSSGQKILNFGTLTLVGGEHYKIVWDDVFV